jgi:hypothetical protein
MNLHVFNYYRTASICRSTPLHRLDVVASEACLVKLGALPPPYPLVYVPSSFLSPTHRTHTSDCLQVQTGEDKPLWMGLLPGPYNFGCCLGVLVRYDETWRHSDKVPQKGLLKKVGVALPSPGGEGGGGGKGSTGEPEILGKNGMHQAY